MTGGLLYQYVGDTASAQTYFYKSREISTAILDTMNRANLDYSLVGVSNAITLIMLDDYNIGNQRLKGLVESQPDEPEYGNVTKKYIQSFMNKSKNDLLDFMINPEKYSR
jgi:hypothetical protein